MTPEDFPDTSRQRRAVSLALTPASSSLLHRFFVSPVLLFQTRVAVIYAVIYKVDHELNYDSICIL